MSSKHVLGRAVGSAAKVASFLQCYYCILMCRCFSDFWLQCIYHLREAHEIFVTGVEFAPSTVSQAVVGPNVDFTLFSISADSQIKAHQLESRRMLLF